MLSCNEPSEVARLATSSAAMILEADHAILRLQDPATRRYSIRSYFGAAEGAAQESLFRLDKAVTVASIRRRAPHLIQDASLDPQLAPLVEDLRSLLTAPLKRGGEVIGTLSVYDKVALDRFFTSRFDDDDLQVFGRFVSYVERGPRPRPLPPREPATPQLRRRDGPARTRPTSASGSTRRSRAPRAARTRSWCASVDSRIARSSRANRDRATSAASIAVLAEALRGKLREFDVLARIDTDEFAVLMPEPGRLPGERVFELARAVADVVSKHETLNQPVRVGLAFGYGVHPVDGNDRETLLAHARTPRIRMV